MMTLDDLPAEISGQGASALATPDDLDALFPSSLAEVEHACVAAVVDGIGSNKTKAAQILGANWQTLSA